MGVRANPDQEGSGVSEATGCSYCSDYGEYEISGILYCGRCALRYVVLALKAEAGDRPSIVATTSVLVEH